MKYIRVIKLNAAQCLSTFMKKRWNENMFKVAKLFESLNDTL